MNRIWWPAAVALGCLLAACVKADDGVPVSVPGAGGTITAPSSSPTATATPTTDPSKPGVLPTTRISLPPAAATCPKLQGRPVSVRAKVTDPAAPIITLEYPVGWSMSTRATGDLGAWIEGRNGMWAKITITKTELGPAEAFQKYADDVMSASPVTTLSVLPADLCGYSGQKLSGAWSNTPQDAAKFADRLAHVWTNTGDYLVAVHMQAPSTTLGFEAASRVLMKDFGIVIP